VQPSKAWVKNCAIKSGGQEMATNILSYYYEALAISWPLLLITFDYTTFFTQVFKGHTSFHSLAFFAWISLLFV